MRNTTGTLLLLWFITSAIAAPLPAGEQIYSILDYGAKSDGKTLCTDSIQKAIDACSSGGGGTVLIPAGDFLSGALRMKSRVTLWITEGSILFGSTNRQDYYCPQIDSLGRETDGDPVFRNLIHGENLHNISIRGKGIIDGNGSAFRNKKQKRTKLIHLINCKNVLVEDIRLRNAGSWMQHYRLCEGLTINNIDVFNHVSFNNDGLNVDSCKDVIITNCRIDSDDDGIVLKSLSNTPCKNVMIENCTVSSHCNALKMGTESGGGFIDITINKCKVFSPRHSKKIYGRQRGLAGIAMEIVDGGRLENVSITNVDIEGVSVPIFLRLGNRARSYTKDVKPGIGTFRNVKLCNITSRKTSVIGCSITGLPGHPIENVTLNNINLEFDGGGTLAEANREIPECETSYPESTMFGTLPAYGFYCRHVRNVTFKDIRLTTEKPDLRHAMMFVDTDNVTISNLDARRSPGAATLVCKQE